MPSHRLVVIGEGPEEKYLKELAGANVEMRGHLSRKEVRNYMRKAKAFIFAAEEDFGIVPLEAQACGTPVIAYGRGGSQETIIDPGTERATAKAGKIKPATGIFFYDQHPDSIEQAILKFEKLGNKITATACRKNALRFSTPRFRRKFKDFIDSRYREFQEK